jgi:uncharacterized protein (TIRG00374 family)
MPPNLPLRAVLCSVALAALGYLGLSLWAGWREVLAAVVQVGPLVLIGLLALSLTNYLLRFLRWARYLALLDAPVAWRINLEVYLSGFALTTSPGKVGEMLRSVLLRVHGVPASASVAAFFAERFSDLLSILVLTAVGLWAYAPARPVVGLALAGVVAALLLVQWTCLIAAIDRWAAARAQKWAKFVVQLCAVILHFRRCFGLSALAIGLAIGVVAWFAEGFGFWWLLVALGSPLPLPTAVFIYAFAMLVGGLSFLPGGLGSSEAVMIALLVGNGFPAAAAVTATLICRLATLWFAVGLGAVFLTRQR